MIVHSVLCFTLLFVCVLQGNVGDRRLEQGVNCHLVLGFFTRLGASLWLWLGHGVWDGVETCFGIHVDTGLGQGLRWTCFSNGV